MGETVYANNEDEVRNGLAVCAAVAFPEADAQPTPDGGAERPPLPDFDAMNRDQVVAMAAERYGMVTNGSTTKGAAKDWILAALGVSDAEADAQPTPDSGAESL